MIQFVVAGYLLLGVAAVVWLVVSRLIQRGLPWRGRRTPQWAAPEHPDVVVTLVHGTWGRHSPWTSSTSPLCRTLLESVEGQVALVPFAWSGGNWAGDRGRASKALRARLEELIARYPEAMHFVIAHSHGGNVVLYALRDWQSSNGLSGVVCLSTPFLSVRRRRLGPITNRSLVGGLVIGAWLLAGTQLPRLGMSEDAAVLLSLPLIGGIVWAVARWSKAANERVMASLSLPDKPPAPTLIIRAPGDEAGAALASVHFLSWLVNVSWVRPAIFAAQVAGVVRDWGDAARRYRRHALGVVGVCLVLGLVEYVWHPFDSVGTPTLRQAASAIWTGALTTGLATILLWWFGAGAGLYGYIVGLTIVGLLLLPFILLLTLCVAPFGLDVAVSAVALDISAEPTPPGEWRVHQLRTNDSRQREEALLYSAMALNHSTYEDPEAIEVVTNWIQARIRQDRP